MGPREYMEDAWVVKESAAGGYFFVGVFDGHGGVGSSFFLRESLYDVLGKSVAAATEAPVAPFIQGNPLAGGYLEGPLQEAYEEADEDLIDHLARLGEPECWSGSTSTTCWVRNDRVVTANIGDSRAIIVRKGKPVELTQDHRPLGYFKKGRTEIDRINRCGGWVTSGRVCGILAVSRAFGDFEFKGGRFELLEELQAEGTKQAKAATLAQPPVTARPDVAEVARQDDDEFLVIATDGLWDTVNSQQAATFLKAETKKRPDATSKELAEALVMRALRNRTQDNVACVVVDLRTPPAPAPA